MLERFRIDLASPCLKLLTELERNAMIKIYALKWDSCTKTYIVTIVATEGGIVLYFHELKRLLRMKQTLMSMFGHPFQIILASQRDQRNLQS